MPRPCLLILIILAVAGGCSSRRWDFVILADGTPSPVYHLSNGRISVRIAPELGGKIISLKDGRGREYLSRSKRPYVRRRPGMKYGDTEFDGIDECFPSLSAGKYPAAPWQDVEIPDHGDLCYAEWRLVPAAEGITLEVQGPKLPYTFRRQAVLDGSTLVLRYRVTNHGRAPFRFAYVFHPLFAGETGCGFEHPADLPVKVSWSRRGFLGKRGTLTVWSALPGEGGKPLHEEQFVENTGRYYKYFTGKLSRGETTLKYRDGKRVTVRWPVDLFPYLAVWCSEGSIGGLHHIAPEPTTCDMDSFTDACKQGKVATVAPGRSLEWEIRIQLGP